MIRYRLNKVYGPVGVGFGVFMIILGCFYIFMSRWELITIIVGSFMCFTDSACVIDVKKFRISFPHQLFGIIRIGDWIYIRSDMELQITETKKPYKIRCASGRTIDVSDAKYLLLLYDGKIKKWYLILKSKSKEKAEKELVRLSDLLDIQIKEGNFLGQCKVLNI